MKVLIILICLIIPLTNNYSQITFSHRMDFDAPAAVLTNVLPTDSCYYVSGIIVDSLPPYRVGNLFAKLDLNGNTLLRKKLTSPYQTFESWENSLDVLPENQFIVSGYSFLSDSIAIFYIKFNDVGEVIEYNQYIHPDSAQASILHRDFKQTPEGGFVFFSEISKPQHIDFHLIKIDAYGNELWRNSYGNSSWDAALSLTVDNITGQVILGGRKTNQNVTNSNYQFQTYITSVDSLGNELWTYLSPISDGLRDGARDMILLDDGSLIVASGIGYEQERPSVNVVYYEKSVFKLNSNQELEWEISFPEDSITSRAHTTNLLNISNDSGFILAGTDVNTDWEVYFQEMGWLAKIDYDGQEIWKRKYLYLDTDKSDHKFFDIKETSDGGFILCGESRDRTQGAEYPQQAWLLKLDEYGCLVPGCHLINDVRETETVSYELKFYPNPTSDYLNIFMRHHRGSQNFTFRIRNGVGQQVAEFKQIIQEETLMIDLAGYSSGVYYLEVRQNGEILETEKFIVN